MCTYAILTLQVCNVKKGSLGPFSMHYGVVKACVAKNKTFLVRCKPHFGRCHGSNTNIHHQKICYLEAESLQINSVPNV